MYVIKDRVPDPAGVVGEEHAEADRAHAEMTPSSHWRGTNKERTVGSGDMPLADR